MICCVRTRAAVEWFNGNRFEDPNHGPVMQVSVAERKAWDGGGGGGRGGGGGGRGGGGGYGTPVFAIIVCAQTSQALHF